MRVCFMISNYAFRFNLSLKKGNKSESRHVSEFSYWHRLSGIWVGLGIFVSRSPIYPSLLSNYLSSIHYLSSINHLSVSHLFSMIYPLIYHLFIHWSLIFLLNSYLFSYLNSLVFHLCGFSCHPTFVSYLHFYLPIYDPPSLVLSPCHSHEYIIQNKIETTLVLCTNQYYEATKKREIHTLHPDTMKLTNF